jgi:hypothetical protein
MSWAIRFLITCLVFSAAACGDNDEVEVTQPVPKISLTLPADVNAGYPAKVTVSVRDQFGKPTLGFTGTVSFSMTDGSTRAIAPEPITFTGSENGTTTTTVTFFTVGSQTLTATADTSPTLTGSGSSKVHGLTYTAPTSGRIRLVANKTQSNAQTIVFDLVANERLEMSSFFTAGGLLGGPGSFAVGMNLPLDTTRATGDPLLFTVGGALPLGNGAPAAVAKVGADHVLYTGISRKRSATPTNFRQATEVQQGGVLYTVRLKLTATATAGVVFDGADPSPLFRAAVRDQYGDDFVSQAEFGIGRLEVK